ncbi:MAG: NusA-like transcription termination signal-binding factor [Thaumarchaeota archaeon]|jgi:N utilization substance protein A|nr:NusA-like transcription termination signal-binding factor [Nitrososphaerota archaeon]HEV2227254.1 NusA-like transcription termination signal-binding factor [Nitrososphaerales archaeon]HLQ06965.1 NusA-like transcription termination signal-binding factor [Nitrososphaerales archaeon]
MPEIKLSSDELSLMSMFQGMTGATARDCVIDEKRNRVIFVIAKGQMGLAIGKDGASVKKIERTVRRPVEVVEWADDVEGLVKNSLGARFVQEVRVSDRLDGTKGVVVIVDSRKKGAVLGLGGKNAEKVRLLARRYFDINNVQITSEL